MDKKQVISLIENNIYYSINDLRYNQKVGFMFSKDEFDEFLKIKDQLVEENYEVVKSLPLKTFNSKHCFFVNSEYLKQTYNEYKRLLTSDYELNQSWLLERNFDDILISRLFSEIEGTLNIENVPTTHSRIVEVNKKENLTDKNDIIIKNMLNAVKYILDEKPAFNKENLRVLYNILSKDSLSKDLELKDGVYYRWDKVYVGEHEGANYQIIDECMNSLFEFANNEKNIQEYNALLPYICHYYILYVHPYFDFNGRTARMVSFWLNYINKVTYAPCFMSEAINENKNDYYKAINETRNTNNDLTYFLGYILETATKYSFVYKNLEEVKKELKKTGDSLTSSELVYVKKIIVHSPNEYFNYKSFLNFIHQDMTRQGALKILNNLNSYGVLEKSVNKKGDTVFRINPNLLLYCYNK